MIQNKILVNTLAQQSKILKVLMEEILKLKKEIKSNEEENLEKSITVASDPYFVNVRHTYDLFCDHIFYYNQVYTSFHNVLHSHWWNDYHSVVTYFPSRMVNYFYWNYNSYVYSFNDHYHYQWYYPVNVVYSWFPAVVPFYYYNCCNSYVVSYV